jgi:hypothetical protein
MEGDLTGLFAQARDLVNEALARLPILAGEAERTSNYWEYDEAMDVYGAAALDLLIAIVRKVDDSP